MLTALILATTVTTSPAQQPVDCSLLTPQQRQGLNCIPPNQAPAPGPTTDAPPVPNPPNPNGFFVGHTYRRTATGTRIFIMGLGQDIQGFLAYTAQCLDENTEDHCYAKGFPLLVYAHLSSIGWEDLGPYPDGKRF